MSNRVRLAAAGGGVLVLAVGAFFLLGNRDALPGLGGVFGDPPTCPLTGIEPRGEGVLERPAVAVKVENAAVAYPLSGLERADVVYEELVEGGLTRFMAIFHCRDASKVGPVRSARAIDPAIVTPITRILAFSGQNAHVLEALKAYDIVRVDETRANGAMRRVERPGLSSEHTLYADTAAVRRVGRRDHADAPPDDLFAFGELDGRAKRARSITINFSPSSTVAYEWSGKGWLRSDGGAEFLTEAGTQVEVDNVLIEEHEIVLSDTIVDPLGTPSTEITDVTGSGRAVLFRDGRAIVGRWRRETAEGPVSFETRSGDAMVFAPGSIWIELVPSDEGEVKGSFSYAR